MPYTKSTTRIGRLQLDPVYNAGGVAIAATATAFLEARITNDSDPTDVTVRPWKPVTFDFLDAALSAVNVTAAGKTVTYTQLMALMQQAILDRATAQAVVP